MPDKATMEEQVYLNAIRVRSYLALAWLERAAQEYDMNGGAVVEMRLQAPRAGKPGWFAVVKGINEDGQPVVAFGSGATPIECIDDLRQQGINKGLRWREDKPYKPEK